MAIEFMTHVKIKERIEMLLEYLDEYEHDNEISTALGFAIEDAIRYLDDLLTLIPHERSEE